MCVSWLVALDLLMCIVGGPILIRRQHCMDAKNGMLAVHGCSTGSTLLLYLLTQGACPDMQHAPTNMAQQIRPVNNYPYLRQVIGTI